MGFTPEGTAPEHLTQYRSVLPLSANGLSLRDVIDFSAISHSICSHRVVDNVVGSARGPAEGSQLGRVNKPRAGARARHPHAGEPRGDGDHAVSTA